MCVKKKEGKEVVVGCWSWPAANKEEGECFGVGKMKRKRECAK